MNKNFCYAEFVTGGIQNRNKIYNINGFKLNGVKADCFRSLFLFDENLKYYVDKTGSVKGYAGIHITDAIPIDFDGEDLNEVKTEVIKFIKYLHWNFEIEYDYLRISFSGAKGFHIVIPFELVDNPQPKQNFYLIIKNLVKELAGDFRFIDFSIYESKRLFRMLNTINSKSGLYKIPLFAFNELEKLPIDEIKKLAENPRKIEVLPVSEMQIIKPLNELYCKWNNYNFDAENNSKRESNHHQLNKRDEILELIQNGITEGNRHSALIRLTSLYEEKGFDYDFTLSFLKIWNTKNTPPLTDERLEAESKRAFNDLRKKRKTDVSNVKIYSLQDAEKEYQKYVQQMDNCKVRTGYDTIDKKIRGIMPGETMCILGKTSVGKSAFLQNIGMNFAKESNEPTLFFSMEMPITSVYERAMQIESELTGYEVENKYKSNSEEIKLKAKLLFNDLSNFYTITNSGLNLEQIKNLILFAEGNIYHKKTGLVLIDYLGLIKGNGKDIYEQVSRVARSTKDIAKELNVPVIFLSQVNRNYKEYDELKIDAARDSGAIDEASDFILGIWKEKDNRPETEQSDIKLKLGILKNRKGGLGRTSVSLSKRSLKAVESNSDDFPEIKIRASNNFYETEEKIF